MLAPSIWLPMLVMCGVAIGAVAFNEWSAEHIRADAAGIAVLSGEQLRALETPADPRQFGALQGRIEQLRQRTNTRIQRSRLAVDALGLLTLVLLVTVVRLLVKDSRRQRSLRQVQRVERQRLEQVVAERTRELSDLTTHLQSVIEQEKAELARDLHDELGGLLTVARMDLIWLKGHAGATQPLALAKLDALIAAIEAAMSLKRRIVENLRPALLDHFGLPLALESYFTETCQSAGLRCHASIAQDGDALPQDLAMAMFRVGQESLTNIVRHAHAKEVHLQFAVEADRYRLRIADDGIGIDPAQLSGMVTHGIGGMRHRIRHLGGQFSIQANAPRGTCIDVSVPRSMAA